MESRRSLRLKGYDYTQNGAYFVTICAYNRLPLFGSIQDDTMVTNDFGKVVQTCWDEIPQHFPKVELDAFVVMPNHLHGILVITTSPVSAVAATSPVSIVGASHDSQASR